MKRTLLTLLLVGVLLPAVALCQPPALLAVWGTSGDQPGRFIHPTGLALDPSGNLYVADLVNHRIQVLSSSGDFVRQWGSYGQDPGSITGPTHLAVDPNGRLFVAEWIISWPQTNNTATSPMAMYLSGQV